MFTRLKDGRGGPYLQVVENYRLGGHTRQRVLLHPGPYRTVAEAQRDLPRRLEAARGRVDERNAEAQRRYRRLLDTLDVDTFMAQHGDDYLALCAGIEAAHEEATALTGKLARLNALVAEHPELIRGAQDDEAGESAHTGVGEAA
jgi:hypothetical protein